MQRLSNTYRAKLLNYAVNFIIVMMVFLLPDMLMDISIDFKTPGLHYARSVVYIIVFYINYFILIPNALFKHRKVWLMIVYNMLTIAIAGAVLIAIHLIDMSHDLHLHPTILPPPRPREDSWQMILVGFASRDLLILILAIGLSIAYRMLEKWARREKELNAIEAERKDQELTHLKNQLNPHFLFNTLNNIYALIAINQSKAQRAVYELSQLLRYMLYENKTSTIPLENEMRFINNYIALMRLRLTSNTQLHVKINEDDGVGYYIAPFMFISIVENAFKYGVSPDKLSFISISITVQNRTVRCCTINSITKTGNVPSPEDNNQSNGIGLANLKRQVEILYPNRHRLETITESNKFTAILEINI
ncbi:MAG: sensor histidine kinase [Muribaculaceae bacterium]